MNDSISKVKIKEIIIVEGRYDKSALQNVVDTLIITTDGFHIFKDDDTKTLIRNLAKKHGVIVLTDSDGAGLVIRNHLAGILPKDQIKHGYIPEIPGKEKRKAKPSKAGFLGVEGMGSDIIMRALRQSGATFIDENYGNVFATTSTTGNNRKIVISDFIQHGLTGGESSSIKRSEMLMQLGLPRKMTAKRMLEVFNSLMNYDDFIQFVDVFDEK